MRSIALSILLAVCWDTQAQSVGAHLPRTINPDAKFVFYLHGGVVTNYGDNAINNAAPEWGPYQYSSILDSLKQRGFHVVSENRKPNIHDSVYVNRVGLQVDSLLRKNVRPANIAVLGASAGSDIALLVSAELKNNQINFAITGGCWPNAYKEYLNVKLYGQFLSIYEASDPHQSCSAIFDHQPTITNFKEIKINTGLSHGFIYRGYKEWIDPFVKWFNK